MHTAVRTPHFQKFQNTVGVRNPQPADTNWTLGAVTCDETRCLKAPAKDCDWLPGQCLVN